MRAAVQDVRLPNARARHSCGDLGRGARGEGVPTARAAHRLALDLGLDLPIVEQVHAVLFSGRPPPRDAVAHLVSRETGVEDPLGVG